MLAIIDYGMGNVASVQKALAYLGFKSIITKNHNEIIESSSIILPGVGSFSKGMENLVQNNMIELLKEEVIIKKKPFLGICLGMQLIFEKGNEPVECNGLGWIEGEVIKMEPQNLNIPHMGWNDINIINNTYFESISTNDFYFIHSYHAVPTYKKYIAATVNYGDEFVACVQKENIFATQFHPEKSQAAGLSMLKTFFDKNA